ncbi:MAG: hypothetical protein IPM63_10080 [Acidobacteriota bacterium]|nr:MAG: hypothetical protein IPM63_10080 [Acidobacteriota bacterium]
MSSRIEVELQGPQFVQSAVEISKTASLGSISRLNARNVTSDSLSALKTALSNLKAYFTKDAQVMLTTSQDLPSNATADLSSASGVTVMCTKPVSEGWWNSMQAQNAAEMQMQVSDQQQSQTIGAQMAADAKKGQMERWKIMQDTHVKISEMHRETYINRRKSAQKVHDKFSKFLKD